MQVIVVKMELLVYLDGRMIGDNVKSDAATAEGRLSGSAGRASRTLRSDSAERVCR